MGACSNLRAQLVSDRWLADVGAALGIEQHLLLGRHAQGDRYAESRLRADATEALIGALYSALGNVEAIHRWLTPHWCDTAQAVLATPHQFGGKTALQGCFAAELMGSRQHRFGSGAPVRGEPAVNRFNVAEGAVQRTDQSFGGIGSQPGFGGTCLLYTSPSPRDLSTSRMPSSA